MAKKVAARRTPKASLASKLSASIATTDHLIVEAYAGTGKTFTQIMGIAWAFARSHWAEIESRMGFKVVPSDEQKAVWEAIAANPDVKNVVYCAFNKSIVSEFSEKWGWLVTLLKEKAGVNLRFATINSLGNSVVYQSYGRVQVSKTRTEDMLANKMGVDLWDLRKKEPVFLKAVSDLVDLCKLTLVGWNEKDGFQPENVGVDELDELCSFYDVELNGSRDKVYQATVDLLKQSANVNGVIDFNDQNWLPVVNGLPIQKVDLILVDEGQDLNRCKQEFCRKLGRRIILVGDIFQAIYGFAGADTESIPRMRTLLGNVQTLKLTETRRCCKAVVKEAQQFVPDFRAHASNPEGEVKKAKRTKYSSVLKDGDMVLSRVNAPLVSEALKLIKAGKKALIRGRDFGKQLMDFVKRMKADDVNDLLMRVQKWADLETEKEHKKKHPSEARMVAIQDRLACISAFSEGAETVQEIVDKMNLVFAGKQCPICEAHYDENVERCFKDQCKVEEEIGANGNSYPCGPKLVTPKGVLFSSVHRAKGLEAHNVFVFRTKDAPMPHPMAKLPWEVEQEQHLLYVATTRAISCLTWVTD